MAKFEQFLQKNRIINKIKIDIKFYLQWNIKIFRYFYMKKFVKMKEKYIFLFVQK